MMRASSGLGPTVLRSSEMGLRNMILRSTAYYVRPRQHVCKWINTGVISNYAISMYNYYRIGCRSVARGLSFRYPLQNSTGSLAYWFMCKTCHMRQYPGDRRCQGPNCRPGVSVWSKKRDKSVLRLLCGELYLTRAPPELRSSFPARSVRRLPLETWTPAPASSAAAAPAPAASPAASLQTASGPPRVLRGPCCFAVRAARGVAGQVLSLACGVRGARVGALGQGVLQLWL